MNIENSGNILKPHVPVTGPTRGTISNKSDFSAGNAVSGLDVLAVKSSLLLNQLRSPAAGSRGDLLTQAIAKLQSGEILSRQSAESAAAAILDR